MWSEKPGKGRAAATAALLAIAAVVTQPQIAGAETILRIYTEESVSSLFIE